ncbi:endonuclease [Verrucomicrobiaceae bacterium 5K15]|uniref:Endonuclease n=1 Tax=Oceaniferula flava TaxID=2800421 RepID=A0AAE2SAK2_9BACT|nr:endonuclease [Oceaniferula flavus]MBK1854104.1 endonuclease [Oceaniferula flavus]MBM1135410.1 endonuclease [Oceaniferula flavus]
MKAIHYAVLIMAILLVVSYLVGKDTLKKRNLLAYKEQLEKQPLPEPSSQDDYYQGLDHLSGQELKTALHQRIRHQRVFKYSELWEALRDLDAGAEGNVLLIYQQRHRSNAKNGGNQGDWNREHLWPRAYGIGRSSIANTDLHHIRASDVGINGQRGHLYFDETDGEDFGGQTFSHDTDSWEPPNQVKGDIARALFYMAVRYEAGEANATDLELSNTPDFKKRQLGKLSTLLQWHRTDPVSDQERQRNQKIHRHYQGNRNPFIDHPEYAERIFAN